MNKKVFVLRTLGYRPDLCEFTIPTIKAWADKISADFFTIGTRHFPGWPVTYEKLQIHELGKDSDWNILIDADVMLKPTLPDITQYLPPNGVATAFAFDADNMFKKDVYFERDGRNIGLATNFVVSTRLSHDLWKPLDMTFEQAKELSKREFILDEYALSRNLAKYGLQHTGILPEEALAEMVIHFGSEERSKQEKEKDVERAKLILQEWKR